MKPLTRIAKLCSEIRCAVAGADLSSETGVCSMMAALRQKLDAIEKQVAIAEKCARYMPPRFIVAKTHEKYFNTVKPGGNALINVFRIVYMLGNKVTMSDGRMLMLDEASAAELVRRVTPDAHPQNKEEDYV